MTGRTVAVIGPMGAGKSSVGRKLAKRLGLPFADTDQRIVARHGAIADLFAERGEPEFRMLEREVVAEALGEGGVVALGGGAVLDPATRADLARCHVVLLTVDEAAVADRLASGARPLLVDGLDSWRRIAAEREVVYRGVADLVVDTSRRPMAHVVEEIAAALATELASEEDRS